jgi:integron cassette protein
MLVQTNVLADFRAYLQGVIGRADHHADNVNRVVIPLAGAIVAFADPDSIEVLSIDGQTKNALWARVNGVRYAFAFDHATDQITMKQGNRRGAVVASFDNSTSVQTIIATFEDL